MHDVLCDRHFVIGILYFALYTLHYALGISYFALCTSQCRQRKGLGVACLWERERATVGHHYTVCLLHIVGATPLVDSGPSNLLIRWPTLLIRWPTLLFRDPLCWFGFPLCWCGSTQLEKWESESGHRPECWFGSCLESTFWSMPKHRIYKVGHIYNLHGPRINKVCHV